MTYAVAPRSRWHRLLSEEKYVSADPHNPRMPQAMEQPFLFIMLQIEEASQHYQIPVTRQHVPVTERFRELADRWRADVRLLSSSTESAMHPAYQQIIALGSDAVPCILRELERDPDHWFWALKAITGVDPVEPTERGRIRGMAHAWLRWAREEGITW